MDKASYRTDIDGLRGIAVMSVVLHHLWEPIVPGGFVGVDIFFVISGFLITSQIYKEAIKGAFSFKQFYKRRINRIIPALATVVAVTLAAGLFLLSPADMMRLANSAGYAMLGLSNIYLWREYGNYFTGNTGEAPLLHTWTLGVEEQFYIIWPLLIILFLKLARHHMAVLMAILVLGGIVLSEIAVGIVASASYYLLPMRFFELMIGGLLALTVAHRRPDSRAFPQFCLYSGLALVGYSLFWLDKTSSFPGINALWPCLGAALLIWGGSSEHTPSRILTNRPLVFLGLISYSLYLWHWPMIAYLNYVNIDIGPMIGAAILFTAIIIAWLSWRFVEVPMRRVGNTMPFATVFTRRFSVPLLATLAITLATAYANGFPNRFDPRVAEFEQVLKAKPEILRSGCHVPTALYETPPDPDKCRLGVDKPELDGILIGDSYANHFTGMVDVMAKDEGISLMDFTMGGCPPILGYVTEGSRTYAERCLKRNEVAYAMMAEHKFERVVLAASWPREAAVGEQLVTSIEAVLNTGAQLSLILKNERIERADSCIIRKIMYRSDESCVGPRQGVPTYIAEIQSRFPQLHIVDPNQVICNGKTCSPTLDNNLLYRDSGHLNDIGSRLIGQALVNIGVRL